MTCRCGYYSTCYLACSARMIELIQAARDAERWAQEQREHAQDKREEREGEPFQ